MINKVVLIHGIGGLGREIYFPSLKEYLENLGIEVFMPSLGGYKDKTTYPQWESCFDKEILPHLDSETIVVAQSMGTQFAVKYIAKRKPDIGLYISTAGPKNVLDMKPEIGEKREVYKVTACQFAPTESEFETFKNLPFEKFSFYSNNDNFFTQENLESYANAIGATKIFVKNKQHFNMEEIALGFKELEEFIKNRI